MHTCPNCFLYKTHLYIIKFQNHRTHSPIQWRLYGGFGTHTPSTAPSVPKPAPFGKLVPIQQHNLPSRRTRSRTFTIFHIKPRKPHKRPTPSHRPAATSLRSENRRIFRTCASPAIHQFDRSLFSRGRVRGSSLRRGSKFKIRKSAGSSRVFFSRVRRVERAFCGLRIGS